MAFAASSWRGMNTSSLAQRTLTPIFLCIFVEGQRGVGLRLHVVCIGFRGMLRLAERFCIRFACKPAEVWKVDPAQCSRFYTNEPQTLPSMGGIK